MIRQNMAAWHRLLYAAGGVAALVWGWSSESGRVALMSLGAIGLVEAFAGYCPGCAAFGRSTKKS